jgi:general secretion pathway protein G
VDPWDREYAYFRNPGGRPEFEIVCYGADGKPGGEEDDADISSATLGDQ